MDVSGISFLLFCDGLLHSINIRALGHATSGLDCNSALNTGNRRLGNGGFGLAAGRRGTTANGWLGHGVSNEVENVAFFSATQALSSISSMEFIQKYSLWHGRVRYRASFWRYPRPAQGAVYAKAGRQARYPRNVCVLDK